MTNYSVKDGLSHPSVIQMEQDKNGYLWIATDDGLNRFDGKSFVQFFADPDDQFSVARSMITSLYKDSNQRIWLGSKNGLAYIDDSGKKFINLDLDFLGDNPYYISEITAAENDNLWLLGLSGLWHFNTKTYKLRWIQNPPNSQVKVDFKMIYMFYGDGSGSLIMGTKSGFFVYSKLDGEVKKLPNFPEVGSEIIKIKVFAGKIWVVTMRNIYQYDIEAEVWIKEVFNSHLKTLGFLDIIFENGQIWAASTTGLWLKDSSCQCWGVYVSDQLVKDSLPSNTLSTLYVDNQSQLWIGSQTAGISVRNPKSQIIKHWLNKRQLIGFLNGSSFSSITVTDIKPTQEGEFLVATDDRGFFRLSKSGEIKQQFTSENTPALQSNYINQLHLDLDNNLWLTSSSFGLQVKTNLGNWIHFHNRYIEDVYEIYQDRTGQMWVGTLAGSYQVDIVDNEKLKFTPRRFPDEVMSHGSRTNVIYQSQNGLYWFGTEAGLVVMDQQFNTIKVFSEFDNEQAILSNAVNDIVEGAAGDIWIATGNGLNRISFSNNQWVVSSLNNQPLLNSRSLLMVEADLKGNIWTAGSNGLFRINNNDLRVTFLSEKTGVQGLEFSLDGSYVDEKGMLYFAGSNGVSVLPDDYTVEDSFNSPIRLSDVRLNGFESNNSISSLTDGSYFIPSSTKVARFYFDVVNLDSTSSHALRIRIPETSEKWLPWTLERHFDLFELPAGNITLEVQSKSLNTSEIVSQSKFKLMVESNYSIYDYLLWLAILIIAVSLLIYLKRISNNWEREKEMLIKSQIKLSETISVYKTELAEKSQQQEQLLDELAASIKEKILLENQINDLHLVDKYTGLHTKEYISLSIDAVTRKLNDYYDESNSDKVRAVVPEPLMLIIKLDNFETLRLEGGQFLVNQMIIQIAAEIKKVCANTDELVKWDQDSFLLYSRVEPVQQILGKCKKIVNSIAKGTFGPSDSEQLSTSCSIAAVQYPFVKTQAQLFGWPTLLELATSAANYLSSAGGNRYLLLSSKPNDNLSTLSISQMEQIIDDFSIVEENHWIEMKSGNL